MTTRGPGARSAGAWTRGSGGVRAGRRSIGAALVVALTDPAVVLLGGPWGPAILEAVRAEVERAPRRVAIEAAAVADEPALRAARTAALYQLRDAVLRAPR